MRSIEHAKQCDDCIALIDGQYPEYDDWDRLRHLCPEGEYIFAQERMLAKLGDLQNSGCVIAALLVVLLMIQLWRMK